MVIYKVLVIKAERNKMSISDQTQKSLEKVGLTRYEIKTFTSLLRNGELIASELSEKCTVPYSKIMKF